MRFWPSVYSFLKTRKETEDLLLGDLIHLLEVGEFSLDSEGEVPLLVRESREMLGHPVLDAVGGSVTAAELADFAFASREKLYKWVLQQSEGLIRWDIEAFVNKLSLWLWVLTIVGWVPFYFLGLKPVLAFWFILPTVALAVSLVKAPLTASGRQYLVECSQNLDNGFQVAVRGPKAIPAENLPLRRFTRLFKMAYRGREALKRPRNEKP
ncbi:hypothetical protein HPY42_04430 [Coprothermobacteraceae bacterium]|nr:hypothetical protein [Coprothermobacteraceae bacterium]